MTPEESNRTQSHLRHWTKGEPSVAAIKVAHLLDLWQGLHHLDAEQMRKADWTNPLYVVLKFDRYLSPGAGMATHDFSDLTSLVFLAHDLCIRVQVAPSSNRYLELMFHPRAGREGDMAERHPTLEMAVNSWRERHPKPVAAEALERKAS